MDNKLFNLPQCLIFSFIVLLINSVAVQAQSIKPDPQILREMIAYAAKAEKGKIEKDPAQDGSRQNPSNENNQFPDSVRENEGKNSFISAFEQKAFSILNQQRISKGLTPLSWNEDMARVARFHSENMARHKFFSHTGIDGSKVADRAKALAERTWYSIGENIAFNKGFKLPVESACQQWMNSPYHRQNLLDEEWTQTGIGAAVAADGSFYLTQVFIN